MLIDRINYVKQQIQMKPGLISTSSAAIELIDDLVEMLEFAEASPAGKITIKIENWRKKRKQSKTTN